MLFTRQRRLYMNLVVVAYHVTFLLVLIVETLPSNDSLAKQSFYYFYMYAVPSMTLFFVIVITTIFLVTRLRRSQRWRKELTSQRDKTSDKENRLVRTVLAINMIFIVCYFPYVALVISLLFFPRFSVFDPYYGRVAGLMLFISGTLQSVSSSINMVFYFRLSSNFKYGLLRTLSMKKRGN